MGGRSPVVLVLCFVCACQDRGAGAALEGFRAQEEIELHNEALVKLFYEEMNKKNTARLEEMLAPNFVQYQPSGSANPMSQEEWLDAMANVYKSFPDLH